MLAEQVTRPQLSCSRWPGCSPCWAWHWWWAGVRPSWSAGAGPSRSAGPRSPAHRPPDRTVNFCRQICAKGPLGYIQETTSLEQKRGGRRSIREMAWLPSDKVLMSVWVWVCEWLCVWVCVCGLCCLLIYYVYIWTKWYILLYMKI